MNDEKKSDPIRLPLTREEALEYGLGDDNLRLLEAVFVEAGHPLAWAEPAPPPEPQWPEKLEVGAGTFATHLRDAASPSGNPPWCVVTCPESSLEPERAEELARRWSRCKELEVEVARLGDNAAALVAALAERTRERDAAQEAAERWLAARDAAEAERDELLRRCEMAEAEVARAAKGMSARWSAYGTMDEDSRRVTEILHGARPVPGEGGGDA